MTEFSIVPRPRMSLHESNRSQQKVRGGARQAPRSSSSGLAREPRDAKHGAVVLSTRLELYS